MTPGQSPRVRVRAVGRPAGRPVYNTIVIFVDSDGARTHFVMRQLRIKRRSILEPYRRRVISGGRNINKV